MGDTQAAPRAWVTTAVTSGGRSSVSASARPLCGTAGDHGSSENRGGDLHEAFKRQTFVQLPLQRLAAVHWFLTDGKRGKQQERLYLGSFMAVLVHGTWLSLRNICGAVPWGIAVRTKSPPFNFSKLGGFQCGWTCGRGMTTFSAGAANTLPPPGHTSLILPHVFWKIFTMKSTPFSSNCAINLLAPSCAAEAVAQEMRGGPSGAGQRGRGTLPARGRGPPPGTPGRPRPPWPVTPHSRRGPSFGR